MAQLLAVNVMSVVIGEMFSTATDAVPGALLVARIVTLPEGWLFRRTA